MTTKKKSTTTSNQTQNVAPPTWTMPGISAASQAVTDALGQGRPAAYTGNFVAAPDAGMTQGVVNSLTGSATRSGELANYADQQMRAMMTPGDVGTRLQDAITAAIHPTYRALQEDVLPGIQNSALMSGAYSNDRAMGVLPTQAIREATESAQRIAAQLGYDGFQAEEDRRITRGGMVPALTQNVMQLDAAQGDLLSMAMQQELARRQALTADGLAQHDYNVRQPYEGLDIATDLLARLSGNYGTTTQDGKSTTVEKTSGLGPIVQGVMGAAMMAAGAASGNPAAMAAGAGSMGGGQQASIAPTASSLFSQAMQMPSPYTSLYRR